MSEANTKQLFAGIIEAANHEAKAALAKAQEDVKLIKASYAQRIEELNHKDEEISTKQINQIKRSEG